MVDGGEDCGLLVEAEWNMFCQGGVMELEVEDLKL